MSSFVMTLNRHITQQERLYPQATGAGTNLLSDIALAAKVISHQVNKAGLLDILWIGPGAKMFTAKVSKSWMFLRMKQ